MDYGRYFYDYSEEYPLASDIEEQLMAVQELVDQGVVSHSYPVARDAESLVSPEMDRRLRFHTSDDGFI